jgi:uncharacterized membrane protein
MERIRSRRRRWPLVDPFGEGRICPIWSGPGLLLPTEEGQGRGAEERSGRCLYSLPREAVTALSSTSGRLIFLDLLRALAVLMMIQGHTVDVLLADEYRQQSSWFYHLWLFVRGMTAPIFLVTTGTVFVYLLRGRGRPLQGNPRWRKGVRRALLLFALGYLLHFPIGSLQELFSLPAERWQSFWAVDVLHLIGSGILLLLLGALLAERFRIRDEWVYTVGALLFFLGLIVTEDLPWKAWLPAGLAAYLTSRTGSLFPLFPWIGYIMSGGVLASYLGRAFPSIEGATDARRLGLRLTVIGGLMVALFFLCSKIKMGGIGSTAFWALNPDLFLLRLGSVLLLVTMLVFVSIRVQTVPPLFLIIGRHTLLLYVVHLVLLYGSAWSTGIDRACHHCLPLLPTVLSVLGMITAMITLALLYHWGEARLPRLTRPLWAWGERFRSRF